MAATLPTPWDRNKGQLYSQPPPQPAQLGHLSAPPPFSPDIVLDYLLFDEDEEINGTLITPAALPSSSDYYNAQSFCPNPRKEEKKPTAQSKAARLRRKRISDRTQELAQLIPGAGRMNTAEMLHAGFKYVKFLQAQVAMLEAAKLEDDLMGSLLESAPMQEKLSSKELCLVPVKLVEEFLKERPAISRPSIARDLLRLLR